MIDTSFVCIAHDEEATIERTLRSISAQRDLDSYEVVVVDDGSRDRTPEIVRRYAAEDGNVRLLRLPRNEGRGAARAAGIGAVRGARIATVDADIVLPEDWWARCRAELEGSDAVGGTAVPDGDVAYLHRRFGLEPRVTPHAVDVTGSNALFRREVFDAVGFDPELRDGEDIALHHAMSEAGTRLRTVDGLVVRHEETKGLTESARWLFQSGRGASRQLRRYRELRTPDLAFGGFLAAAAAGTVIARRGHRRPGLVLGAGYLGAAATAHLRAKFDLAASRPHEVAGAVAVNAALLGAYFAGRLAGVTVR